MSQFLSQPPPFPPETEDCRKHSASVSLKTNPHRRLNDTFNTPTPAVGPRGGALSPGFAHPQGALEAPHLSGHLVMRFLDPDESRLRILSEQQSSRNPFAAGFRSSSRPPRGEGGGGGGEGGAAAGGGRGGRGRGHGGVRGGGGGGGGGGVASIR